MKTRRTTVFFALAALAWGGLAHAGAAQGAAPASAPVPPYTVSDANAGTAPMRDDRVYRAFHGKAGIDRVVAHLAVSYRTDARIKDIFAAADFERLQRMLSDQICYIVGGPCRYTGRDMKAAHENMGLQTADFDALVEDLQQAMDAERVPVWAQNRLLAKLAPMKRVMVTR